MKLVAYQPNDSCVCDDVCVCVTIVLVVPVRFIHLSVCVTNLILALSDAEIPPVKCT